MQLIIFFNGWGMNEKAVSSLEIDKNFEIIIINYPYILPDFDFEKYEKIYFIGWSFGVYYMCKHIGSYKNKKNFISIAINGTPFPIGKFGINEKIFNSTLENLNLENLKRFYKNMGASFESISPQNISLTKLKEELLEIKKFNLSDIEKINYAIIGKKDRIIPYKNQYLYFKKNDIPIIELDIDHYPFYDLKNWRDIIEKVKL